MYSDIVKKGLEKTPHRSLFKASGFTDEEIERPLIGVVSAKNEIIPGHIHLENQGARSKCKRKELCCELCCQGRQCIFCCGYDHSHCHAR